MSEKYRLFWGGIYSQWYKETFSFAGMEFNCAEQMMMYAKAKFFKDEETAKAIMETKNPRDQKKLGRKVKGFDAKLWDTVCREVVYTATCCKFFQHNDLYDELMKDPVEEFVEASPFDKIWGIGLAEDDPKALDKSKWEGENRLGICITEAREFFRGKMDLTEHNRRVTIAQNIIKERKEDE